MHLTVGIGTLKVKVQESDFLPRGDRFALYSAKAQRDPTHFHSKLLNKYLQICLIALFTSMAALVPASVTASPCITPELAVTTMTIIHSIIFTNPLLHVVIQNEILFIWGLYSLDHISIATGKSITLDVHLLHLQEMMFIWVVILLIEWTLLDQSLCFSGSCNVSIRINIKFV